MASIWTLFSFCSCLSSDSEGPAYPFSKEIGEACSFLTHLYVSQRGCISSGHSIASGFCIDEFSILEVTLPCTRVKRVVAARDVNGRFVASPTKGRGLCNAGRSPFLHFFADCHRLFHSVEWGGRDCGWHQFLCEIQLSTEETFVCFLDNGSSSCYSLNRKLRWKNRYREGLLGRMGKENKKSSRLALIAAVFFLLCLFVAGCGGGDLSQDSNGSSIEQIERYSLEMDVSCEENLFFSRYDVDVYVDDEKVGTLDHGMQRTFDLEISEGTHVFRVAEKGNSSVDGSWDFDMPSEESILKCSISCNAGQVSIEEFSFMTLRQASEEEERVAEEEAEAARQVEKAEAEAAAARAELEANGAQVPKSAFGFKGEDCDEVVAALTSAGFENIVTFAEFDLDTPDGGLFSGSPDHVANISIDGDDSFSKGDWFEKTAEVFVYYHAFKYDDPSIAYNSYTVAALLDDLESNAMRAKEDHDDELMQIEGYIDYFDASGGYVTVKAEPSDWAFENIWCDISTDAQREILKDYSVNDCVCLQGKITTVGEIVGYHMDIHRVL